jgi:hypothetical protein
MHLSLTISVKQIRPIGVIRRALTFALFPSKTHQIKKCNLKMKKKLAFLLKEIVFIGEDKKNIV